VPIALLARFPRLHPPGSYPVIPDDRRADYPGLAADFAVLDEVVTPEFVRFDTEALRGQHRYRSLQVTILLGSAVVTGLGGLQVVFSGQRWPGVSLAVLGAALAFTTRLTGEQGLQARYLSARLKAERLRGLYFRYLSRTFPYEGEDRVLTLRRAVLDIGRGKEPE
jgi:hypothetical protein